MEDAKAIGVEAFLGEIAEQLSAQSHLVAQSMSQVRQAPTSLDPPTPTLPPPPSSPSSSSSSQPLAVSQMDRAVMDAKNSVGVVRGATQVVELLSVALKGAEFHASQTKIPLDELNHNLIADVVTKLKKYLQALYGAKTQQKQLQQDQGQGGFFLSFPRNS